MLSFCFFISNMTCFCIGANYSIYIEHRCNYECESVFVSMWMMWFCDGLANSPCFPKSKCFFLVLIQVCLREITTQNMKLLKQRTSKTGTFIWSALRLKAEVQHIGIRLGFIWHVLPCQSFFSQDLSHVWFCTNFHLSPLQNRGLKFWSMCQKWPTGTLIRWQGPSLRALI